MARWFFRMIDTRPPGQPPRFIPQEAFLYFNAITKVNEAGFCEGIVSIPRSGQAYLDMFDMNGDTLDSILEVWYQVVNIRSRTMGAKLLFDSFLLRYSRRERLNDGRLRVTFSGKSAVDILDRVLVYPDRSQAIVTVDNSAGSVSAAVAQWDSSPWSPATSESFTGGGDNSDTKYQMEASTVSAAVTNSEPFSILDPLPTPSNGGGVLDHKISYRNNNLLSELQRLSAASWYAAHHSIDGATTAVDFDIVATSFGSWPPLAFVTFPGGRGTYLGKDSVHPLVLSSRYNGGILPVAVNDRRNEATRLLVGADGSGVDREMLRVESAASSASPYNTREASGSARSALLFSDGINDVAISGRQDLQARGQTVSHSLVPIQTGGLMFGYDYFKGDVLAIPAPTLGGAEPDIVDMQVYSVDVKLFNHSASKTGGAAGSHEQITVGFSPTDGSRGDGASAMQSIQTVIAERLRALEDEQERTEADE